MRSEKHKGYTLWGHAILQQKESSQRERYAASGTITLDNKVVEASGVLGEFGTEDEAELAGLRWARAWVDSFN
ncbi:conserved hypothetical protein [Paraburkholderia piptadeniae]|uniref:Transposase n=2 Tax=Paraburkholderia TaxID=1822464 RepID=A0A7X1TJQ8_9BURK|nr:MULTISPECIES: hypothetical protein [Paraburkholderia]MPW21761.1 hypothetical protein [Paraburkholderia franconis]RZF26108.1 hypothetical protein EVC45_30140 [Paraburkholderia sp. UYCP14C]SIT51724.1 conserved hypothetical protein [Paraburkholderia piptadeniae]